MSKDISTNIIEYQFFNNIFRVDYYPIGKWTWLKKDKFVEKHIISFKKIYDYTNISSYVYSFVIFNIEIELFINFCK